MLSVSSLTKKYDKKTILDNINIEFPQTGFVAILGKSGCGKSTFLHCIGLLEDIDGGSIKYKKKDISHLKDRAKRKFLNKEISYVFQNYQLIEDRSVLFNVALPMVIAGERQKFADETAKNLLKSVNFEECKAEQIVNTCSGGEKQRIAILRAIINEPNVILADEPTGALDSKNTKIIADILKKYSQKHLVIFVTHNKELAEEYADRIITFSDGKVSSDWSKSVKFSEINESKIKPQKSHSVWINSFIEHNFSKRFKRNFLSGFACVISLVFAFLIVGFTNGSKQVIDEQLLLHFDVGTCSVSSEETVEIPGSKLSLIQQSRLTNNELMTFVANTGIFDFGLSYDALVPQTPFIKIDNESLDEFSYLPIYSFSEQNYPNLLIEGKMSRDKLTEVVINKKAADKISKITGKSPLNSEISISYTREVTTYFDDYIIPYVTDFFVFSTNAKITGIVDELEFLSTPKIYYSYKALDSFMESYLMNNLSEHLGSEFTFKDKIDQIGKNDELSSYSNKLFLKNINDIKKIKDFKDKKIAVTSDALTVQEALSGFIDAATMGTEIFLIITVVGSVLILGITSFASYSQDIHQNAILLSLGASRNDILDIYIAENLIIGVFSFLISLALSVLISPLINNAIFYFTKFQNLINIPIKSWMNCKFMLPILAFGITVITSIFSSYLPIAFSKKISISKELKEE